MARTPTQRAKRLQNQAEAMEAREAWEKAKQACEKHAPGTAARLRAEAAAANKEAAFKAIRRKLRRKPNQ